MERPFRYLITISGMFGALLIISNVLSAKIVIVCGITFPASVIVFPLTYVIGDVLTEVYGYANARRVIWAGFVGALVWALTYWLAAALPSAPFWSHQAEFEMILGLGPRLAFAGILAYLVGEFMNSYIVARMKVRTSGRHLPVRLILSTAVGQALDTTLVLSLAFAGTYSARQLLEMGVGLWLMKVAWEILALPITIPTIQWLKDAEQVDIFDVTTDFSPFAWRAKDGR